MSSLYVIGAGGHAKVIASTAKAMGMSVRGVYDDSPTAPDHVLGYPVIGGVDDIRDHPEIKAVIAVGSNSSRKKIASKFQNLKWVTLVHPTAWVDPAANLEAGVVVLAGSVVQADAKVGRHTIINTCSSVDHDCILSDFVHIAPGAHLAGNVTLGEGVFAGVGSAFIPGVNVGEWSILGAGTTVIDNLPSNVTAVGTPSRIVKIHP